MYLLLLWMLWLRAVDAAGRGKRPLEPEPVEPETMYELEWSSWDALHLAEMRLKQFDQPLVEPQPKRFAAGSTERMPPPAESPGADQRMDVIRRWLNEWNERKVVGNATQIFVPLGLVLDWFDMHDEFWKSGGSLWADQRRSGPLTLDEVQAVACCSLLDQLVRHVECLRYLLFGKLNMNPDARLRFRSKSCDCV